MEKTDLICKNIRIGTHRTSMRLENEIWSALEEIAHREHCKMNAICDLVNHNRPRELSLTAAVRLFIITYFRKAATEEGHFRAGHGKLATLLNTPSNPLPATTHPEISMQDGPRAE
ncbi:MAG TPA: hypothetical protein DCW68_06695 [Rhodospirillaceae bacterium]|nr:MAG: hypothetical protein A2018_01205 [Alphaproteobacteria bacterium GWF2_58_20]HAU29775.1 hypothetical protein [Rhodospirillaceae bacterium]